MVGRQDVAGAVQELGLQLLGVQRQRRRAARVVHPVPQDAAVAERNRHFGRVRRQRRYGQRRLHRHQLLHRPHAGIADGDIGKEVDERRPVAQGGGGDKTEAGTGLPAVGRRRIRKLRQTVRGHADMDAGNILRRKTMQLGDAQNSVNDAVRRRVARVQGYGDAGLDHGSVPY